MTGCPTVPTPMPLVVPDRAGSDGRGSRMRRLPVHRALVSVSDKTGLVAFARRLNDTGVEIVASGGTARVLVDAGIPVTPVADVTGAPEMLGGRVKTLHPAVHGGILADLNNPSHRADLTDRGIEPFEIVVVNLYPFEATVAAGASTSEVIENIDIGGPTLIRAAAKNHRHVAVVVSPDRYDRVAAAVEDGGTTDELRLELAREAFFLTARYDAAIVNWFERDGAARLVLPLERHAPLRYGENPHQEAALYRRSGATGWWTQAERLQGKEMSFNNYADADAAWRLVNDLPPGSAVVLKHMNACGAATGDTPVDAFTGAWSGDPLAAFGGVVAFNGTVDAAAATEIAARFVEIVVAPAVTDEAKTILQKRKNLRVLVADGSPTDDLDARTIDGGFLVQKRDDGIASSTSGARRMSATRRRPCGSSVTSKIGTASSWTT